MKQHPAWVEIQEVLKKYNGLLHSCSDCNGIMLLVDDEWQEELPENIGRDYEVSTGSKQV